MSSTSTSKSTDRPRLRSATIGSIQTLTRALRESLRLRKLRKQKRRINEAKNEQMRRRSKSVGNADVDDEISDFGISVVVASDIGPVRNTTKYKAKPVMQQRRQSKSVDDVDIKKRNGSEKSNGENNLYFYSKNGQIRRRSKDDHDLPKVSKDSQHFSTEQKGFRKRFGFLFGSLRMKHQTHTHLQPSPASSPSTDCEEKEDKKDMTKDNHQNNDDIKN